MESGSQVLGEGRGAAGGDLEADIRRSFPRNAVAFIAYDAVWNIGCGFVLMATTIPFYLTKVLGASMTFMQVVATLSPLMTVLQLWGAHLCRGPRRRLKLLFLWLLFPACWMAYGLVALLGWGRLPHALFLVLFPATCIGLGVVQHLGIPPYAELVLDATPLRWRGRLAAIRCVFGGLCQLGGTFLAALTKSAWPTPLNFHVAFLLGPAFMAVSCAALLFMHDHAAVHDRAPRPHPFVTAKGLLRTVRFRTFLIFFGVGMAAQSLTPLILACGTKTLGMQQEGFTAAVSVGVVLAGALVPHLADRFGFRLVGIINAVWLMLTFAVPVVWEGSPSAMLAAYALYGGTTGYSGVLLANLGSELAPNFKAAAIVAVGSILAMVLGLLVAPLGGAVVDLLGPAGYRPVFLGGIALGLVSLVGFAVFIREPRSGNVSRESLCLDGRGKG